MHKTLKKGYLTLILLLAAPYINAENTTTKLHRVYDRWVTSTCIEYPTSVHLHGLWGECTNISCDTDNNVAIRYPNGSTLYKRSIPLPNSSGDKQETLLRTYGGVYKHSIFTLNSFEKPENYHVKASNTSVENKIEFSYNDWGKLTHMKRANKEHYYYEYDNHNRLAFKTFPNNHTHIHTYDNNNDLIRLHCEEQDLDFHYIRDDKGHVLKVLDAEDNALFLRERLEDTNIETQANGLSIAITKSHHNAPTLINLGPLGYIRYTYSDDIFSGAIVCIERLDIDQTVLYEHTFDQHDDDDRCVQETLACDLGTIQRSLNVDQRTLTQYSPYGTDKYHFDMAGNVIQHNNKHYQYDGFSQMEGFDGLQNPQYTLTNALNQVLYYEGVRYTYDIRGNLITKIQKGKTTNYTYDTLNRLISVTNDDLQVEFTYDPFGRRMSKKVYQYNELTTEEYYLYQGKTEIGSFDKDGNLIALRIINPDTERAIAIETPDGTYAPIYDLQDNVKHLIDIETKEVVASYSVSPFGRCLHRHGPAAKACPWIYMCKRLDLEIELYYFEQRYYDPRIRRWITPDLLTETTPINQYAFLNNNPFRYKDPDGQLTWDGCITGVAKAWAFFKKVTATATIIVAIGKVIENIIDGGATITQYFGDIKAIWFPAKEYDKDVSYEDY